MTVDESLKTLEACNGAAMRLSAGEALKVVNVHGTQVVDCWAFNPSDFGEYMSMAHTRNACWRMTPVVGEHFVTNHRRPILFLAEDTSPGVHDTLIPCCDSARYAELGHVGHRSCSQNMAEGLLQLGVTPPSPPPPLNLFMNIATGPTGRLEIVPPKSKPGDFVVLRAEMDCIVALSACPHDILPVNGIDAIPREVAYAVVTA